MTALEEALALVDGALHELDPGVVGQEAVHRLCVASDAISQAQRLLAGQSP